MALEIEGKIVRRLGIQRGVSARGNWAKQEFIVEFQDGNFPAQACLNVWGEDKVKDLERFSDGDEVKVSFHVSSREFNGKWYTDLRAWRIEPAGGNSGAGYGQSGESQNSWQNNPVAVNRGRSGGWQNSAPAPQAPAPTIDDMTADLGDDDDLPF
ncbi:MAG: DUF3127 domain-containing protein [Bacteroidales bacterium]|nr:DUF3127 domain-containing protein [Bacteroidales bacterium]